MIESPLITIVVPSFNQGQFLEQTLLSIFEQKIPIEVFVMDGGSTDNSLDIIRSWSPKLTGWRSYPDGGQAAAINEGITKGKAPYVCWLNSDDFFLPGGLSILLRELENNPTLPAVYSRVWNQKNNHRKAIWVEPFNIPRLARRCIISQPGTLIRRTSWERVGGLDVSLQMAMDYDLWWRLVKYVGPMHFVDDFTAVNCEHSQTKTNTRRAQHYKEAINIVKKHHGFVPLKWWLVQPYAVWFRSIKNSLIRQINHIN